MPDRQLQRTINGLKVYCTHVEEGCDWTGKVGGLEKHLRRSYNRSDWLQGCKYTTVQCRHCQGPFSRKEVVVHMDTECPEYKVPCEYEKYGCKVSILRKNTIKHMSENRDQHKHLVEGYYKRLQLDALGQFSKEIRGKNELNQKYHVTVSDRRRCRWGQIACHIATIVAIVAVMMSVTKKLQSEFSDSITDIQKENTMLKQTLDSVATQLSKDMAKLSGNTASLQNENRKLKQELDTVAMELLKMSIACYSCNQDTISTELIVDTIFMPYLTELVEDSLENLTPTEEEQLQDKTDKAQLLTCEL